MSESRKPFLIGAFLLSGVVLLAAGLLLLSRDSLLSRPVEYVVYFTGALDGLDVGADVTYRGVKIGNVRQINLSYDRSLNDVVMPVTIRINTDSARSSNTDRGFDRSIEPLIERGLRAQLQTPSLLTGKAIVALDFFAEQPGYIRDPHIIDLPAIPTVPSRIDQVADVLRDLAAGLREMPLKETLETANKTL
jgi:paraquat-inducible protein B